MALCNVSGHLLNKGDRVKMNISVIGEGDLDGVQITCSGKDYWRYMNEHPDEVYTVEDIDFSGRDTQYILSGYMSGNTWYAEELIHVPEAATIFEVIKNMDFEEMKENLFPLVLSICEDGVPSSELIEQWLRSAHPAPLRAE